VRGQGQRTDTCQRAQHQTCPEPVGRAHVNLGVVERVVRVLAHHKLELATPTKKKKKNTFYVLFPLLVVSSHRIVLPDGVVALGVVAVDLADVCHGQSTAILSSSSITTSSCILPFPLLPLLRSSLHCRPMPRSGSGASSRRSKRAQQCAARLQSQWSASEKKMKKRRVNEAKPGPLPSSSW
jgi:hypothetical protein